MRVQPNGFTVFLNPAGASCQIGFVLWLGRDTRKTDILAQFFNESGLVLFQIFQHLLHEEALYQPGRKDAKANGPDAR